MQYDTVEEWESAMTTLKAQGHKLVERSDPFKRTLGFKDTTDDTIHEVGLMTVLRGGLSYRWVSDLDSRRKRIEG